jgi:site-specific DNA-cytosine methylase
VIPYVEGTGRPRAHDHFKQTTLRELLKRGKEQEVIFKPLVQVVDLFCGGGGFTEGAVRAGAEVVLSIDCWEPAIEIHKANHPDIPCENYTLGGSIVETAAFIRSRLTPGAHFHLHGSPPCQKLSNASKGDAEEGMVLVNWFIDLVRHMKPDSWSMENVVPVAKKIDKHRPGTPYVKLNSADFGVPQTRNRIFAGEGWVAEPTHTKDDWVSVIEALPHLEGELNMTTNKNIKQRTVDEPMRTITSKTPSQTQIVVNTDGCSNSVSRRALSVDRSVGEPAKTVHNNRPTLRVVLPIQRKIGVLKKNGRILQPLWREKDEPINTITSLTPTVGSLPPEATRDNPMKATKIRSLTLEETAILQGFSADMKIPYKRKKDAWTVLGNAVCPPVAEAIIRGLK